jgi:hypothetical protein
MASAGADWQTDPRTQLRWMVLDYMVPPRYANACDALAHERADDWY